MSKRRIIGGCAGMALALPCLFISGMIGMFKGTDVFGKKIAMHPVDEFAMWAFFVLAIAYFGFGLVWLLTPVPDGTQDRQDQL